MKFGDWAGALLRYGRADCPGWLLPDRSCARRLRAPQAQLIVEERRKLRRNQIRALPDEEAEAWIAEMTLAAHLSHANIAVPVGDRPVGRDRLETDALQPIDWRMTKAALG